MITYDEAKEIMELGRTVISADGRIARIIDLDSDGETDIAHVVGEGINRWEDTLDLDALK